MKSPAVLSTAPAATAWPSHAPPTDCAIVGRTPVVHWLHGRAPLASAAPIGRTYAAVSTGRARKLADRKARSGERASPRTVEGGSQPEEFHITTAQPRPRGVIPRPAAAVGGQ